jgi:hypothetical protein
MPGTLGALSLVWYERQGGVTQHAGRMRKTCLSRDRAILKSSHIYALCTPCTGLHRVLFRPQRCFALVIRNGSASYGCPTWRSSWPAFVQLGDQYPLRNIGERCKDSSAIQAFSNDGKYLINTPFVPTVIAVATEELGIVCSRVQPIKSSCMVPLDTTPGLVEMIRASVPAGSNISSLGAPLTIDFSMADGPHNENGISQ